MFVTGLSQADLHGNISHFLKMKDLPITDTAITDGCLTNITTRKKEEIYGYCIR